jgi:hypothetical protein
MITNRRTCRAARAFIGVAALSLITASAAPNAWAQAQEAASSTGCGPGGAFEALASFGPFNEFNYPAYYVDQNGLALDLCDETIADDPLCGNPLFGDPLGVCAAETVWEISGRMPHGNELSAVFT